MLGALADLLDLAFQKLDTSSALDQGIVAYDVSEHSKDGKQIKYLSRTALPGPGTETPSSKLEQNGYKHQTDVCKDTSIPRSQDLAVGRYVFFSVQCFKLIEANPLTKCSLMMTHWTAFTDPAQLL